MPPAIWVFSALLHPVILAFALLIRRFSLALVAVIALSIVIVGMIGNEYFMNGLFGEQEVNAGLPFSDPYIMRNNTSRQIELPKPVGNQIRYTVGILTVILLYITVYFRIKEREV